MKEISGKILAAAIAAAAVCVPVSLSAQEANGPVAPAPAPGVKGLPSPVNPQHFAALMQNSPFTRSLNLSESLILTGVATVDGKQVATLMNKQTKETFVVSEEPNTQGWKMVEFAADMDLEKVAAKITMDGGEVVTVRYDEWSLKPGEAKPGGGGSGGQISGGDRGRSGRGGDGKSKGFGGGPSPEMRDRMMKLSEDDRRKLFGKMMEIREKNPDMSREKRGELVQKELEKIEKNSK